MSYYLQMDGVDDYLLIPTITVKKITFDAVFPIQSQDLRMIIDASTGLVNAYVYARTSGTLTNAGAVFSQVNFSFNGRITTDFIAKSEITSNIYIFSSKQANGYFSGQIYSIKCYDATNNLVAHYDMSAGTVQDISGNGNHATLTGGTWVQETSTEPTEPEPTTHTLSLSDSITTSDAIFKSLSVVVADAIETNEINHENIDIAVNDSISSIDTISYTQGKAVNLSDSIAILDSITKALSKGISDSVDLADTDDETVIKSLIDNIALSDSISTFGGKSILLTDSISVTDSIGTTKQLSRFLTESINISDSFAKQSAQSIKLYDVIVTDDSINVFNPDAPELIGVINLQGKRELFVYLQGKRDLTVHLQGKRELTIRLKGGLNMVENQNFKMASGNTKTISIDINENLVGASVRWSMKRKGAPSPTLTKTGSIVDGKIHIVLDKEDTEGLSGLYVHECEVIDQIGYKSTVTRGTVNIK